MFEQGPSPVPSRHLGAFRTAACCFLALAFSAQLNAGDILRGGATMPASRRNNAETGAGADIATQVQANAQDQMARTAKALQSVRNMQNAARNAAIASQNNAGRDPNHPGMMLPNVPNGLVTGGLDFQNGSGITQPQQSTSGASVVVDIKQTQQQALINWKTFNVGRNTTLKFDQTAGGSNAGEWVAFNKITDPSGSPSQILGAIEAIGQVYVINQNGIIFGGGSQVNVHTLVASSLPINDNLIDRGLLNNPDDQFLFSSLPIAAGSVTPAFTPTAALTPDGHIGDVVVQEGATITSPTNAAHTGGRVALIGANVSNDGTITTPDGQTILAAGLQVGLAAHDSTDATLRGLDVYVGAILDPASTDPVYAGTALNDGLIEAPRADVWMAGKNVNQMGVIDSTTSVTLNGRVDLKADYNAITAAGISNAIAPFAFQSTGVVTLGPGSVIQILPEYDSTDKVVGTALALPSQVNIEGQTVHFGTDSILFAPSAQVNVNAGSWFLVPNSTGAAPEADFKFNVGQIYLDSGAMIDVAGSTNASAPVDENILSVELRGAELADSPLQRDGPLRSVDQPVVLSVDIRNAGVFDGMPWVGTPLGNLQGFVNLIQRTVAELTSAGGTVNLHAGGSVVTQAGSTIDVSGGYINYQAGMVPITRVMSNGQIVNIADATPDRVYDGIYTGDYFHTDSKWGMTTRYRNPLALDSAQWEPSYIQGSNGGSITITAPSVALDGTLRGNTVNGPRQIRSSADTSELAAASSFTLNFTQDTFSSLLPAAAPYSQGSPTPPSIIFADGMSQAAADAFSVDSEGAAPALRSDRLAQVVLSPQLLTADGFGSLSVDDSDGSILIPAGVSLAAPAGGSIALQAANIDVEGSVSAPGGSLKFTVYDVSRFLTNLLFNLPAGDAGRIPPVVNSNRGHFVLGAAASLSAAGLLVDDRLGSADQLTLPVQTTGGSIDIETYSADLAVGSVIDVSGGEILTEGGGRSMGNAGSIKVAAGQDPNLNSAGILGGQLMLGATLRGFSGATGGSLALQAPQIQIGGSSSDPDTLVLAPEFFDQGGFSNFSLTGFGSSAGGKDISGVLIEPGTDLQPIATTAMFVPHGGPTGSIDQEEVIEPEGVRSPVSLSFAAKAVGDPFGLISLPLSNGEVVMGLGSRIQTDALGSVSFQGNTVDLEGLVIAPGGSISVTGGKSDAEDPNSVTALVTVVLGPQSLLSTAGKVLLTPDPFGRRMGSVLPGGSITVSGNIVAERGAVLDVSGATGMLDALPSVLGLVDLPTVPLSSGLTTPLNSIAAMPVREDSNGGSITLTGDQELYIDATLLGQAGGPTALGGSLSVSSSQFYLPSALHLPDDMTLVVAQSGPALSAAFYAREGAIIGQPVVDAAGMPIPGKGFFAVDAFTQGGFDSLTLSAGAIGSGGVEFSGPVSVNARESIVVGRGGVISADGPVTLTAPYVALGGAFVPPLEPTDPALNSVFSSPVLPTFGPGSLTVNAKLIDIGNLVLKNVGQTNLIADDGDIRGDGTFDLMGNLYLRAGQIYPATEVDFTIADYDYQSGGATLPGTITIAASGNRQLPLSAGGVLSIYASIINQGGVLRAPLGTINLGWDGTGDAPANPIASPLIPSPGFPTLAMSPTQQLTLQPGSVTSVSAVDNGSGEPLLIPYGLIGSQGLTWIDPSGIDITDGGIPSKQINLAGRNVSTLAGSVIDVRGGGDIFGYSFIAGNGGSTDILASSSSFAVIPGYSADFAPYAAFSQTAAAQTLLGSDPGYVNSNLSVGDRIYLDGADGLAAGVYTLLPARYALLPGAFLVTPKGGAVMGSINFPDGSSVVSGYRFNDLAAGRTVSTLRTEFEVDSSAVVNSRAQYVNFTGNSFLSASALAAGATVPRLPIDSGHLVFDAVQTLNILGQVKGDAPTGGIGAYVDISSPSDILITDKPSTAAPNQLVLNPEELNGFDAASLFIGGIRQIDGNGETATIKASSITVDNAGSPLVGPEIILAANGNISLLDGAEIEEGGDSVVDAERLSLSGPGTFLEVSSNPSSSIARTIGTTSATPSLQVGAGAVISGENLILDSSYGMSIDPTANLMGSAITLDAGQISLQLDHPGAVPTIPGLMLEGPVLAGLENARSLSLLSYSSLDIYGDGAFDVAGSLALHAGEIRGFNNGGVGVTVNASSILLDNSANATGFTPAAAPAGSSLTFTADQISLGANTIVIDQYADVNLNASQSVVAKATGGLLAQNALTLNTPSVNALQGVTETISAGGALLLQKLVGGGAASAGSGLGASLTLQGASVTVNNTVFLPSGLLTLHATTGDLTVNGLLDVAGVSEAFFDLVKNTDGGNVSLISDDGSILLGANSVIDTSAPASGGNGGTLSVSAGNGSFTALGSFTGKGGTGGEDGNFSLDVGSLPFLAALSASLRAASFDNNIAIRVRTGDVTIDGSTFAHSFNLSADLGSIDVLGTIDASGATGGSIDLEAHQNLTLSAGSLLTVAAQNFDDAGMGGSVTLEAGTSRNGVAGVGTVDIAAGSTIDLSVAAKVPGAATVAGTSASVGDFSGKLHIRAPQNIAMTDLSVDPILGTIVDPSSIQIEGYEVFDLTDVGGVISGAGSSPAPTVIQAGGGLITSSAVNVEGSIQANGNIFGGQSAAIENRLLSGANASLQSVAVVSPGAEIVNTAVATPVSLTLNTSGASSVSIPAGGGTILFPQGTTGNNKITSSLAGTIISATGQTTALAAGTPTSIPAGSSIVVGSTATISFASGGTGGPVALQVAPGVSFTTSTANTVGTVNAKGAMVTFNTAGTSGISLAAGSTVLFTVGTPTGGTRRITSTVAGTVTSATGVITVLAANTPTTIAAGSSITLNSAGTLNYTAGTGTGTPAATLLAGSFTTVGPVGLTPASGNITLGTPTSTTASDWNLSTFRYGPQAAPGVLTLRAAGNLVFYNALSDGFVANPSNPTPALYNDILMASNAALPMNTQSWSYRLTAGADLSAADFAQVTPLANLAAGSGSVLIGKDDGLNESTNPGVSATTAAAVGNNYQVIRTGAGDIDVNAGRDVQLLNEFSTIYTAGALISNPTALAGGFSLPVFGSLTQPGTLGVAQETPAYPAQYTMGGGNVTIDAQNDIARYTKSNGLLVADSEKELPMNWLDRRGFIDPLTGEFGIAKGGDTASTSWWIDFSNFFEGIGALGGGNVTLTAGNNVSNVDAVVPTNMRVSKDGSTSVELGGGDVVVRTGADIDAGVYYVERGQGTLQAGGSIHTNITRSPSDQASDIATDTPIDPDSDTWLPTTLFLGQGSFDVSARGDVLLGPVANPFLLPEGYNNTFWYKTYFSTYAASDAVDISSLGGSVTLRESAAFEGTTATPLLQLWLLNMLSFNTANALGTQSGYQPWLRLDESSMAPFSTVSALLPPTLRATAFSGDINLDGNITTSPSAVGTIDLLAAGSINGLQREGSDSSSGVTLGQWGSSVVNLSDANPSSIPGILDPLAAQTVGGTGGLASTANRTVGTILDAVNALFAETGATDLGAETKQALHDPGLLHADDPDPVHLYAATGDISGLTLFSGKSAFIQAGSDITDIAFYLQNDSDGLDGSNLAGSLSVVAAGGDIIAYDANSPLLIAARSAGNLLNSGDGPLAGDIQISGPGTLDVLAGKDLDLGIGAQNADGTAAGITSIGDLRDSYLPFAGAAIFAEAGLSGVTLDTTDFLNQFDGLAGIDVLGDITQATGLTVAPAAQNGLAVELLFSLFRDNQDALSAGVVATQKAAFDLDLTFINSLFGKTGSGKGDILTRGRDIRTKNGGDIYLLAPNGGLTLEQSLPSQSAGAALAPPGVITEDGGGISIFAEQDVNIGVGRIFTLNGGDETIWSSDGNIAAGSSSKTVQTAPPTRVVIDPQSGNVSTDLSGLATGGGIGVLASVPGAPVGNVYLLAPNGVVDAGDAGIRSSGNISIGATKVLNAGNIAASGNTSGVPSAPPASAPNISGLTSAANTAGAGASSANAAANQPHNQAPPDEAPSVITVEVVGYGGGDTEDNPSSSAEANEQNSTNSLNSNAENVENPSSPPEKSNDSDEESKRKKHELP